MVQHKTRLTAPEISALWMQYLNDTLAVCFNQYALAILESSDIASVYEFASSIANDHVSHIKQFLTEEHFPIPHGFSDEDVDVGAPKLYSDEFLLNYLYVMTLHGLSGYAVSLSTASRPDIREYYRNCTNQTMELHERVINLLQEKGLYIRPPYVNPSEKALFVEHKSFLTGWFGNRRPLNSIEISNITFNMNKMSCGMATLLGFSQVAQLEEVRTYLHRGNKLAGKHMEVFQSIFNEDHLSAPISHDSMVLNSTVAPFSDKLMMFQTNFFNSSAVAFYGAGMAVCMRKDLSVQYERLILETMRYAKEGTDLMILNGWLEQPPMADDRNLLINYKN
jgi:hypothetical protein